MVPSHATGQARRAARVAAELVAHLKRIHAVNEAANRELDEAFRATRPACWVGAAGDEGRPDGGTQIRMT